MLKTIAKHVDGHYCLAIIICFASFFLIYPDFNLTYPLSYQKDGLFISYTIKSIIDTGWILFNSYTGAPGIASLVDYPSSDLASFLILKFLTLFSSNYVTLLNIFYLLTYVLCTVCSFPIFKRLGLKPIFALSATLLFTFAPYHVLRGEEHLLLNTYYVIPLYVLLLMHIYDEKKQTVAWPYLLLVCIFAASSGVYYAFFACYFIIVTGLIAALKHQSYQNLAKTLGWLAVISLVVWGNVLPNSIARHGATKNTQATYRHASDSELFGLKIVQMILPVDGHRLKGWQKSKERYNKHAPLVSENRTASLGLMGSLGLLALLALLLFRHVSDANLFLFSRLAIFGILLGTIGGFGTFFAYEFSDLIRSYNRISIFILFFSLAGFFTLLQAGLKRFPPPLVSLILMTITLLGLWDQTPTSNHNYADPLSAKEIQSTFLNDQHFIERLEVLLPPHSAIFQLPYMGFPEEPDLFAMNDYDPFRPYLHSKTLHWSYGAIKGREIAQSNTLTSILPVPQMIASLQQQGFAGIYLDTFGYADHGVNISKEFTSYLHQQPLSSDDKRFLFYRINSHSE